MKLAPRTSNSTYSFKTALCLGVGLGVVMAAAPVAAAQTADAAEASAQEEQGQDAQRRLNAVVVRYRHVLDGHRI